MTTDIHTALVCRRSQAAHNKSLEPTGLSVKHFAKKKSEMLATEARGSACR
jgi:hypothetical protein